MSLIQIVIVFAALGLILTAIWYVPWPARALPFRWVGMVLVCLLLAAWLLQLAGVWSVAGVRLR